MEVSVVIPIYDCEECLSELCIRLHKTLALLNKSYEIILVNDGSDDLSWEMMRRLAKMYTHVKGIRLSKNFGQHYAITAGIEATRGDWIVVMDCDLQDPPEEIIKLYRTAKKGYDIVFTERKNRHDPFIKKILSICFNTIFELLTGVKSNSAVGNFSICSRQVIESFQKLKEQNRSYLQALRWMGFKHITIPIAHAQRYQGKSAYNFMKSFTYGIDSITAYTNRPLTLSIQFGFIISLVSFLIGVLLIIRHYYMKVSIIGWTSLVVTIFFSTGLIIADLGIIGTYIGKIFNETKKRPLYIIRETIGFSHKKTP